MGPKDLKNAQVMEKSSQKRPKLLHQISIWKSKTFTTNHFWNLKIQTTNHVSKLYCKQVSKWNNDVSADIYWQNINNWEHAQLSYLYEMERGGECARQQRDRESVWVGVRIVANRGSVGCKNGHWKNRPFRISQNWNRQICFNCKKVF